MAWGDTIVWGDTVEWGIHHGGGGLCGVGDTVAWGGHRGTGGPPPALTPGGVSARRRVKYSPLLPAAPPAPRPRGWLPPGAALRLLLRRAFGGAPSGESSPLLRANTV